MRHALMTRLLHLLLATCVVLQLADAQFMGVPRPGRTLNAMQSGAFGLHEYVGLAAMAVVALFWLALLVRRAGTAPGSLFPWFSRARRAELWADLRRHAGAARRLSLPDPEGSHALAAALHGLGLVIVLVMAATGTLGWLTWDQSATMTPFVHTLFEVHETVANLLWAYLVLHVGATLLHELVGHRLLRRMSPLTT